MLEDAADGSIWVFRQRTGREPGTAGRSSPVSPVIGSARFDFRNLCRL